jgi:AcrR family transcriptional regulator
VLGRPEREETPVTGERQQPPGTGGRPDAPVTRGGRPLRADAQRNREQLLAVAVAAFSREGPEVTLESIARDAGVGIGTLYRHFPSREALVDAAYRSELARLCDSVPDLLAAMPADKAMRTWMEKFIDYMTTKRGMADALRAVIASGGTPFAESRSRLLAAFAAVMRAGAADGTLRADLDPADLLASMTGVSLTVREPGQREQASRLLELLMDGLRYGAGGSPRTQAHTRACGDG